jgi:hypothetical protein
LVSYDEVPEGQKDCVEAAMCCLGNVCGGGERF